MNIEYLENRLRSLFFVLEFDRPDFIVGLYLYINLSLVDVTVVTVNKLTLRQMWSLVTSIGKGDKSCDFND